MEFSDIVDYRPEQLFLLQGTESFFDTFLAQALVNEPFVHSLSVARFTMDNARALAAFITEGTGEERFFIIFFSVFSSDAAQVLLKSLEEPDLSTTIILVTPYPYTVPATIRSRVRLVQNTEMILPASTFSITTRDTLLAQIKTEFGSDAEDGAAVRKARAVELLDALEVHVRKDAQKAELVYGAKKMLLQVNLPPKFVLDYAASVVL